MQVNVHKIPHKARSKFFRNTGYTPSGSTIINTYTIGDTGVIDTSSTSYRGVAAEARYANSVSKYARRKVGDIVSDVDVDGYSTPQKVYVSGNITITPTTTDTLVSGTRKFNTYADMQNYVTQNINVSATDTNPYLLSIVTPTDIDLETGVSGVTESKYVAYVADQQDVVLSATSNVTYNGLDFSTELKENVIVYKKADNTYGTYSIPVLNTIYSTDTVTYNGESYHPILSIEYNASLNSDILSNITDDYTEIQIPSCITSIQSNCFSDYSGIVIVRYDNVGFGDNAFGSNVTINVDSAFIDDYKAEYQTLTFGIIEPQQSYYTPQTYYQV